MSTIRISRKAAQYALEVLRDFHEKRAIGPTQSLSAIRELTAALKPKPAKRLARKRREVKRASRKDETAEIRRAVFERAQGVCEHCGLVFDDFQPGQLDHFFGRGKARQSVKNCWALGKDCHRLKTKNFPSPAYWLGKFRVHAEKHGYQFEAGRAIDRLDSLTLQGRAGSAA